MQSAQTASSHTTADQSKTLKFCPSPREEKIQFHLNTLLFKRSFRLKTLCIGNWVKSLNVFVDKIVENKFGTVEVN
jgi:hypothetical protein